MAGNDAVRIGLVGAGGFGQFCMEAFAQMSDVRPAAVADISAGAAKEAAGRFNVPCYTDAMEMIAREKLDLVHIATPPASHHQLVLACAKARKHVLCEKPLATSVEHAREMLDACRRADVICPVNFVLRYNSVTEAVHQVIASGVLGSPLSARLTNCASDSKLGPGHWFWDKQVSGGIFIEHGVHFFDLYNHWLGGSAEMLCASALARPSGQEDRVTCLVRHGGGGALASHYHGFDQPGPLDRTDHRIVMELGDIRVEGWIPLSMQVRGLVSDEGIERLAALCEGAEIQTLEDVSGQEVMGRGSRRPVTRLIELTFCPRADKQQVYADSVRGLLADQLAYVRNRSHQRRVTESNGLAALELARQASAKAAQR